jgi:hypothetical protein
VTPHGHAIPCGLQYRGGRRIRAIVSLVALQVFPCLLRQADAEHNYEGQNRAKFACWAEVSRQLDNTDRQKKEVRHTPKLHGTMQACEQ